MVLPYFNGAAYFYEHYIRPMFVKPQTVNMWSTRGLNKSVYSRPDDVLVAAEKYIEQNGPGAFEKLISRVYLVLNSVGLGSSYL